MFPRRFPWLVRPRKGATVAPCVLWVVRDLRTGRYWHDPYALGARSGDPRHHWRPRRRAYVFPSERVARTAIRATGLGDRVAPFPASDYAQHIGGRVRPEISGDDGGDPLKRSGWATPPPHPDTCTVQLPTD